MHVPETDSLKLACQEERRSAWDPDTCKEEKRSALLPAQGDSQHAQPESSEQGTISAAAAAATSAVPSTVNSLNLIAPHITLHLRHQQTASPSLQPVLQDLLAYVRVFASIKVVFFECRNQKLHSQMMSIAAQWSIDLLALLQRQNAARDSHAA